MSLQKGPQSSVVALLLALAACSGDAPSGEPGGGPSGGAAEPGAESPEAPADRDVGTSGVRPGITVLLEDSLHLVRGRRVGLITNHTGIAADPAAEGVTSTIDLLDRHPEVELVALYGPEHGIRGTAEAGEEVGDETDPETGLPIYSLYTSTRRPPEGSLEGVEVLVFDMQDVGARYYTYVSTMAYAMEEAGALGIPFVVLDRPNPIDGVHVQGTVLNPEYATFVGLYPVPMRHGMTPGELARLYVGEFGIDVELHVVPADGWHRAMRFWDTGLPWRPPSPNMPSPESALHYPGTCLFEGTPLSVGRGTAIAFQIIGAPWLDAPAVADRLNAYGLPGVRFAAVSFTPDAPGDGKFGGQEIPGIRFVTTDPDTYDPTHAAVAALLETRQASGDQWEWRVAHFDRLAGTNRLREQIDAGAALEDIVAAWEAPLATFRELRDPYLIYR